MNERIERVKTWWRERAKPAIAKVLQEWVDAVDERPQPHFVSVVVGVGIALILIGFYRLLR